MFNHYTDPITYWASPIPNGDGGETWTAPRHILGRWEDRNDEFTLPTGESAVSRAVAFVKEDVSVGGYLMRGTSVLADPTLVPEAQEIRAFVRTPSIRHNWYERRALLI